MIPKSYELKRFIAQHRHRFWCADALDGLPAAPVYTFTDQEQFNSDAVEALARTVSAASLRLPHRDVLFEVLNRAPECTIVAFVTTTAEGEILGFLFMRDRRNATHWTDALCWAQFRPDGFAECTANPSIQTDTDWRVYAEVLTATVWRALAILANAAAIQDNRVPQIRRPKLARAGVSGWIYRVVDIDPERLGAARQAQGGTHASPRWHIRRGHWRCLPGGRSTFVRECQVGDPARGGVAKDYRVVQKAVQ